MRYTLLLLVLAISTAAFTQSSINLNQLHWIPQSHSFWVVENGGIVAYPADDLNARKSILTKEQLLASAFLTPVEDVIWSGDSKRVLLYTNSKKVWRGNTRGDYWFFDLTSGKGVQLGKELPSSSLMFAKFSPDGQHAAYVSGHNLYLENLTSETRTALTTDGTERVINGTFDWAYEEELSCRDGFRWSADSKRIAYWHIDATQVRNHYLINNTDSLYPFIVPVEYPKAGEKPSPAKVGVVDINSHQTTWMAIPGDQRENYLPRMEWENANSLIVMQLNRAQNEASLFRCNPTTGTANEFFTDKDDAWVEAVENFAYDAYSWWWVEDGKFFLYTSDRDGWRHIYKVKSDGTNPVLITKGAYDAYINAYDATSKNIYFIASPRDATQRYLYKVNLNKPDTARVTPAVFSGTNYYTFSPDGKYAKHINSNINRNFNGRLVQVDKHKKIYPLTEDRFQKPDFGFTLEKIKVKTSEGVELDGIMAKPNDFDPNKKYPVCFHVYGEPANTVANDIPYFDHYIAQLIPEGYIGIALDNRGTPAPKGREWRKSIYKKVGTLNTRDQALAAREILKWKFIDPDRIAVHGWSGGGNMTLNLLFRYPEIYKTGVAVSSVTDHRFYDNIYTERIMGLPQQNADAYRECSPITYARNLKGNLLYIHGTGDDNVHFKNGEVLINELIRQNKLFSLMIYPNRTHSISEGEGTEEHVANTIVNYLLQNNPAGAK